MMRCEVILCISFITEPVIQGKPLPDEQCGFLSQYRHIGLAICRQSKEALGVMCSKRNNNLKTNNKQKYDIKIFLLNR